MMTRIFIGTVKRSTKYDVIMTIYGVCFTSSYDQILFLNLKKIASRRLLWRVFTDVVVEWIDKSSDIRIPYVILHQTALTFIDSLYAVMEKSTSEHLKAPVWGKFWENITR